VLEFTYYLEDFYMSIASEHPEYGDNLKRWETNRDVCSGSDAVKLKRTTYLPDVNEGRTPPPQDPLMYKNRYDNYLLRAQLVAFAKHTLGGLVGMVYSKDPAIFKWPAEIQYLLDNMDGAGLSHIQMGKKAVREVIEVGRVGGLADYPKHGIENPDRQTLEREAIRASIQLYLAESIVDWNEETVRGVTRLNYVKLKEVYTERSEDFFEIKDEQTRYRVLRLRDGVYTQALYDDSGKEIEEEFAPLMDGQTMDFIPFRFAGSENNRPNVDEAPISGIVDINLGHYRNSANLEESDNVHSGANLIINSNMSVDQFKEANPQGVKVGANEGLFLGADGSASLLQTNANSSTRELMKDKQAQAESLGAVFANQTDSKNVTAEAARINAAQTTATLTTTVGNVSEMIEFLAQVCAGFMTKGVAGEVEYSLNQDFHAETFDPQIAAMLETGVLNGWISESEAEAAFKKELEKSGVTFEPR